MIAGFCHRVGIAITTAIKQTYASIALCRILLANIAGLASRGIGVAITAFTGLTGARVTLCCVPSITRVAVLKIVVAKGEVLSD